MQNRIENKILTLLGFAQKAGVLCSGDTAVTSAIANHKAKLVLLMCDAASSTKDKIVANCIKNKVKLITMFDKNSIGNAIGKSQRSAIAIMDKRFSDSIIKWYEDTLEVNQ